MNNPAAAVPCTVVREGKADPLAKLLQEAYKDRACIDQVCSSFEVVHPINFNSFLSLMEDKLL